MSLKADTPTPPDPTKTAQAQSAANVETARAQAAMNRINQVTPYGSSTYTQAPPTTQTTYDRRGRPTTTTTPSDQWSQTVTLSPNQQALLSKGEQLGIGARDLAVGQIGRISDAISQPFSYDGMPEAPKADEATRQRVVSNILSRLDPQFQRDRSALESRLAAQGINLGSEAYTRGMDELGRNKNDALIQADQAGMQEMQSLFNMGSSARERAIQEAAYSRAQPINEAAALMGTGQGVQMPQFSQLPQTGIANSNVADIIQNGYNNQIQAANMQNAPINAAMGGLFGLGGSALGGWANSGFKL